MAEDPNSSLSIPPLALWAKQLAASREFNGSCTDSVGRLLMTLAAACSEPVLELGTGFGVGTAWMAEGARSSVVSVEIDVDTAESARGLFADRTDIDVVTGTIEDVAHRGPFGMVFVDTAEQKDNGQPVIDLLSPGGIVVLDDFTPVWLKDDEWKQQPDERREFWLHHPLLHSVEVLTTSTTCAIIYTKRA